MHTRSLAHTIWTSPSFNPVLRCRISCDGVGPGWNAICDRTIDMREDFRRKLTLRAPTTRASFLSRVLTALRKKF